MKDLNMHQAIGHVGNTPVLRKTSNDTPVCNFSLYCNSSWTDKETNEPRTKSVRHDYVAFNGLAETLCKNVKQGQQLYVVADLDYTEEHSDKGYNVQVARLVVDHFQFLGKKES